MTPEQKAKELIDKYAQIIGSNCEHDPYCLREECQTKDGSIWCKVDKAKSKEAATLAVDEILAIMNEEYLSGAEKIEFWNQVKEKIQSLCTENADNS